MGIRYLDEPQTKGRIRYLDEETQFKSNFKPKQDIIDKLVGITPQELSEKGNWVAGGLQQTAKDVASIPMEFFNQMASGFGRPLLRKATGVDIPQPQSGAGALGRFLGGAAGFTAGIPGRLAIKTGSLATKIPQILGHPLLQKIAGGAVGGATAGFLSTPDTGEGTDILKIPERGKQAAIAGLTGAALPVFGATARNVGKGIKQAGGFISGIEKETLDEVSERGFRNVLQRKYFNKKMPEIIQNRIENNLNNLEEAASLQYDELTKPLRNQPFDMAKFRGDVIKIANRVKKNPFKTDVSRLDNAILNGVVNKAKANNLGDALDLRRSLDDVIYSNKGELKSSFGKQVRDLLKRELHKNTRLKKVDNEWTSLKSALREGKKVIGETGEKFLGRFSKLTSKQKSLLVNLEKKIGGEPFVEDLTNWSLAQQFRTKPTSLSPFSLMRATTKPVFRGGLRTTEAIGQKIKPVFSAGKKTIDILQKNPISKKGLAIGTGLAAGAVAGKAEGAQDVDMTKIYSIESSNNPKAFNKKSKAKGLGQITPIVLKEWNNFNKKKHTENDLYDPKINKKISQWYMNKRIPQMLRHYKKPDTLKNRLISYNAGIDYVVKGLQLPQETKNYLKKYGL